MYLVVDTARGDVRLADPHDFRTFGVVATPPESTEGDVVAALGDEGSAAGDEHVWVAVNAPRRLMGRRRTEEWETAYSEMIDHAHERGRTNGASTLIRAHIQR